MPQIVLELGSINIPDNAVDSGLLTQADLMAWVDEQYDTENAGGDYTNRFRAAFVEIGKNGVTSRTAHHKLSKARAAVGGPEGGLVE